MRGFDQVPRCAMNSVFNHDGFEEMIGIYSANGGTTTADGLAQLLEERSGGGFDDVAEYIVSRGIVSFEWRNHYWIPLFQFDMNDMSLKRGVSKVTRELSPVLDNWTLALWFTEPNVWLDGNRPVDRVDSHISKVLDAARADRFVAAG